MNTRLTGITGIVTAVVLGAGYAVIGTPPGPDEPASAIASFFTDERTAVQVGMLLVTLSLFFSALFVSLLYRHLRAAESAGEGWALAGFAGWLGATAVFVVGAAVGATIVLEPGGELAPETVAMLYGISTALLSAAGVLTALSWAGIGISALRSQALPRWSAAAALVLVAVELAAVIGLVAAGSGVVVAQAGVVGYLLWLLATGAWFVRAPAPGPAGIEGRPSLRSRTT